MTTLEDGNLDSCYCSLACACIGKVLLGCCISHEEAVVNIILSIFGGFATVTK